MVADPLSEGLCRALLPSPSTQMGLRHIPLGKAGSPQQINPRSQRAALVLCLPRKPQECPNQVCAGPLSPPGGHRAGAGSGHLRAQQSSGLGHSASPAPPQCPCGAAVLGLLPNSPTTLLFPADNEGSHSPTTFVGTASCSQSACCPHCSTPPGTGAASSRALAVPWGRARRQ